MPDLKDQLHAVWLCFEIPRAGGHLLEMGAEDFLQSKRSETLGNEFEELVKNKTEAELQDTCIGPLQEFAGPGIPHVMISTTKGYKETLTNLIQITESCVNEHLVPEATVMSSVAHTCTAEEFRELMMGMLNTIQAGPTADPTKTMTFGLSMVGTIAGVVSALAGPVTPIVVPIAVGAVLVVWVHEGIQNVIRTTIFSCAKGYYEHFFVSHAVLQHFMSYIIHLTLVLQTLFIVSESQELTCRAIKLAVKSYLTSPMNKEVLTRIQDYVRPLTILECTNGDTLDKIKEMMQFYKIDATQMSHLQAETFHVDLSSDKPW
ncbi:uncharacterized protein F5147DRAFT_792342 [Suillus discolor]|uniref:Uncharacterized protein n=1 Tax=Suillus discolor TaxID=1912936 RepID=A0A9P7ES51_9AGAM|nr:uncharacterized protein F5147DRAFT_792342 [Suillus discolor]KAG2086073.1 hypothetical protein F5147DRAFT_792342 [Suillus discolor]